MTPETHETPADTPPLPQSGGSYVRQGDGSLQPAEDAGVAPPEEETDPARKPKAAKPKKEA